MLVLIATLLLFFIPAVMLIVRLFRPRFAYHWVFASLTALTSFVIFIISNPAQPQEIITLNWQPKELFPSSPAFLLDHISWHFALALIAVALASLLTAVIRQPPGTWEAWAGILVLTGLGIFAVLAGNPLTLMLSWSGLDFFELILLLRWVRRSETRLQVLLVISTRVLGIAILIFASFTANQSGLPLDFSSIPPIASLYMLIAAGFRLGVLPLHAPFLQDRPFRKEFGTLLRLVPTATSLMLLVRTAESTIPAESIPWLLAMTGLAGIYSAISWLSTSNRLSGRPYWILGVSSLSVVAAIRSQPQACLAWSLVCIVSGALIFLFSHRSRFLIPVTGIAVLGLSSLPYTPTWIGLGIYSLYSGISNPLDLIFDVIFGVTQLALLLGVIRHMSRSLEEPSVAASWTWFFYVPGLSLLLIIQYFQGWITQGEINIFEWRRWLGLFIGLGTLVIWILIDRNARFRTIRKEARIFSLRWIEVWEKILSLKWLYRIIWIIYHLIGRVVNGFTVILEGDGGILWAVVLFLLLFSISQQVVLSQ